MTFKHYLNDFNQLIKIIRYLESLIVKIEFSIY